MYPLWVGLPKNILAPPAQFFFGQHKLHPHHQQSTMVLDLPRDAWWTISLHLSTPDILSFLTVHPNIHGYLSTSSSFWACLLARDCDEEEQTLSDRNNHAAANIRKEFMLQSYKSLLPKVEWLPLDINRSFPVTPREGHLSCEFSFLDVFCCAAVCYYLLRRNHNRTDS